MGEYLNIMVAIHPPVKTGGLLATNFINDFERAVKKISILLDSNIVEKIEVMSIIEKYQYNEIEKIFCASHVVNNQVLVELYNRAIEKILKLKEYIDNSYAQFIAPRSCFISKTVKVTSTRTSSS